MEENDRENGQKNDRDGRDIWAGRDSNNHGNTQQVDLAVYLHKWRAEVGALEPKTANRTKI